MPCSVRKQKEDGDHSLRTPVETPAKRVLKPRFSAVNCPGKCYEVTNEFSSETPSKQLAGYLFELDLEEELEWDENEPLLGTKRNVSHCGKLCDPGGRSARSRPRAAKIPQNSSSLKFVVSPLKRSNSSHLTVDTKSSTPQKSAKSKSEEVLIDGKRVKLKRIVIRLRKFSSGSYVCDNQLSSTTTSPSDSVPSLPGSSGKKRKSDEDSEDWSFEEDSDDGKKHRKSSRGRRTPSKKRTKISATSKKTSGRAARRLDMSVRSPPPMINGGDDKYDGKLYDVRERLHTSEVPERMPCREVEFERISSFIRSSILDGGVSQAMYISGVPGTGKTATVLQAVRRVLSENKKRTFLFIHVNAMELMEPKDVFVSIYAQIPPHNGRKVSATRARQRLNEMFAYFDPHRLPILILLDELDILCTKRQDIVYDVFNWSANDDSRVSVIAIANTLDLPERLLDKRVASRLGANRICFQAYDHDEIASIIRDRLRGLLVVDSEAVELTSRKVAALSGDLRKALDILRRGAQIAINECEKNLKMKHIQSAIREASSTFLIELVRSLPLHSVLILRAVVAEQLSSGLVDFPFHDILKQYRLICHMYGVAPLSVSSAYLNTIDMCSSRLLSAAPGSGNLSRHFRLHATIQDVQFALRRVDDLE
ncbi:hypothetical protein AB6A40_001751 [Gnathostoma spinigerum]|uniref:Origin recognition complex subunit 1 n=1 Tax=Gnathostoma spinigerum TaxID=75299 RepID=A0ABD6E711_9BILA